MNTQDKLIAVARLLKTYTAGRYDLWMLAGTQRRHIRKNVIETLLCRAAKSHETGIFFLEAEITKAFGIEGTCSANTRSKLAEKLTLIANSQTAPSNVAGAAINTSLSQESVMSKSKKSASKDKKSGTPAKQAPAVEAAAAVAAVTEPAKNALPAAYIPHQLGNDTDNLQYFTAEEVEARNQIRKSKDKSVWVPVPDADPAKVAGPFLTNVDAVLVALLKLDKASTPVTIAAHAHSKSHEAASMVLKALETEGKVVQKVAGYYKLTEKGTKAAETIPSFLKVPDREPTKIPETETKAEVAAKEAAAAPAKADGETAEKPAKKARTRSEAAPRPTWKAPGGADLGMCEFIRAAGSLGLTKPQINYAAQQAGFTPSPTTIAIQSKKGVDGEDVPALKGDDKAQLKAWAKDAPEKAKKSAAKKPAKDEPKDDDKTEDAPEEKAPRKRVKSTAAAE